MNNRLTEQNERYREHFQALSSVQEDDKKAASLAVGGDFERIGKIEFEILKKFGLKPHHSVVDVGCGSGRLASSLNENHEGSYLGTDVVPELLEYAQSLTNRKDWRFEMVNDLIIPMEDGHADFACFFSVFTHLLHEQTFRYLRETHRVLKTGGKIIFSFLEFKIPSHWAAFEGSLQVEDTPHLNMFMDRFAIEAWADHLDLKLEAILDGDKPQVETYENRDSLGQSVAVLVKE
jgi:ubiquinone/menaquinone biosynthesis C-methylase UbiE